VIGDIGLAPNARAMRDRQDVFWQRSGFDAISGWLESEQQVEYMGRPDEFTYK
jgi:hypothetical protein